MSSLGEGPGIDGEVEGIGLELLGDTYVMVGDLADRHLRDGQMSTWWLTTPGIDVEAFGARLGATYTLLAEAFAAPAHPYRVFLRTHPNRGANASAHPASFVMALNPTDPLDETALYETLAHELVHEWLRLDGPVEDVTWFVEGSADYYSLVLPLRAGLVGEDAFLEAVNFEARECYANVRRDLGIREAQQVFFTDFMAHRLPYARGLFYLADLDARLSAATSGGVVRRRHRQGRGPAARSGRAGRSRRVVRPRGGRPGRSRDAGSRRPRPDRPGPTGRGLLRLSLRAARRSRSRFSTSGSIPRLSSRDGCEAWWPAAPPTEQGFARERSSTCPDTPRSSG